jgi:hypothetical protein
MDAVDPIDAAVAELRRAEWSSSSMETIMTRAITRP